MNQTKNKIKKIISQQLGYSEEEIEPESNLTDDLGADSLDLVEIVINIEEEFNVDIDDKDTDTIKTVGDWFEYAEKQELK